MTVWMSAGCSLKRFGQSSIFALSGHSVACCASLWTQDARTELDGPGSLARPHIEDPLGFYRVKWRVIKSLVHCEEHLVLQVCPRSRLAKPASDDTKFCDWRDELVLN